MSPEYNKNCCWRISKFSLFYNYFIIFDTKDYLADQLFIRHKVCVWFGNEYTQQGFPYLAILCRCRKCDTDAFLSAVSSLPHKMLLCGYSDYLTQCESLSRRTNTFRDKL